MAQRLTTFAAPPSLAAIRAVDPEVADCIAAEQRRQETHLELIASENFVHPAILAAQGCVMTNKYAEGLPGKRYYGGCEFVDAAESLAIERAKALFGAEHANVQPHSGAQANMAAYFAFLQPGDTIMGMNLSHGGHLTHGSPVNFSGRLFRVVPYGVRRDTERVDFDEVRTLARAERPKLIVVGGSAYPRYLDFAAFREIADEVGALLMVDMAHFAGLVAARLHPDPVPYADIVTSTTHKTLRGPRAGFILCKAQHAKAIDASVFPGVQGGPLEHVIAAKAICFRLAAQPEFRAYQEQIVRNARAMADELARRGFRIVSGGTDTHLLLVDVTERGLTGRDAEEALGRVRITVNKNTIPFDTRKPFNPSGVRIGTPAVTTRGMGDGEMRRIAAIIDAVLSAPGDDGVLERARGEVAALCAAFPLYGE